MTKVHNFIPALLFPISSPDYTYFGMPVLCGNFFKYADRIKTRYAAKMCEIMPHLHIHIKPAYGNGESDSLCGKICDMHTSGKYATGHRCKKTFSGTIPLRRV